MFFKDGRTGGSLLDYLGKLFTTASELCSIATLYGYAFGARKACPALLSHFHFWNTGQQRSTPDGVVQPVEFPEYLRQESGARVA